MLAYSSQYIVRPGKVAELPIGVLGQFKFHCGEWLKSWCGVGRWLHLNFFSWKGVGY